MVASWPSVFRSLTTGILQRSVRDVLVVVVDQGLCSIVNFVTAVLVGRACGNDGYGLFVLGQTLLVALQGFQASLSGTPFTIFSPRLGSEDRELYLGSTLIQNLVISAVAALGFVVASVVVSATGRTDDFASVLLALSVASVFVLLRDFMRYVLLSQLRVWASLVMGLVANLSAIAMLFWAYTGHWLTAPNAYFIMASSSALPALFVLLSERRRIAFSMNELRQHLKKNWQFGQWLIARTLAYFFAIEIYPWALAFLRGPATAGIYGACMTLVAVVNPLFMGVNRYLGPKTAHAACEGTASVRRIVRSSIAVLAIAIVLFVVAAFTFGSWALGSIFGVEYQQGGYALSMLAIGLGIAALASPITSGIDALGKPRISFLAQLIGAGVSLTLGAVLVYAFGLLGAASGYTLSMVANALYRSKRFSEATRNRGADV